MDPSPGTSPQDLQPLFAQAVQRLQTGRLDEAEQACQRILSADPAHAGALNVLGIVAGARGRGQQAIELIRRSLASRPDNAEAWLNLGGLLQRSGRVEEALGAYRQAVALKPEFAPAHFSLGVALGETGRSEAALEALERAVALKPDHAPALAHLALALQELGRQADAREAAEKALALDPGLARAWRVLSDLKTFTADDPDIGRMQRLLEAADQRRLAPAERLDLEFALGKAWMDVGDADRAFAVLETANRRKRAAFRYDVEADAAGLAAIGEAFTPELMARLAGAGDPTERPVFVIGMPRSGSTLVEQIVASHPEVHGGGEMLVLEKALRLASGRGDVAAVYLAGASQLTPAQVKAAGRAYAGAIGGLAPGKRRVVDKSLENFRYVGLLSLMLPEARIIHCRRDPLDLCLSCYAQNFADYVPFAYDLRELGLYYRAQEALMAHWRALLPASRFLEVDYEQVVQDLEGQARRMIAFCGLDWDPACLDFHKTARPIRTASVNQVRRPLYQSSIGRWRPYARHLGPLFDALGLPRPAEA